MPFNKVIHTRSLKQTSDNGLVIQAASLNDNFTQTKSLDEMLDGITLTVMTDLKLVFLFKVDKSAQALEKNCEELTTSIISLVESKQVSSLREIWPRIVNDVLS